MPEQGEDKVALNTYRTVASDINYWVVSRITPEKFKAQHRSSAGCLRTIEGSLENVRQTLHKTAQYYLLPLSTNPENIVEVWY